MDRFFNEDAENEKPFFGSEYDDDEDDDMDEDDMDMEEAMFIQSPDIAHIMMAQDSLKHELLDKAIKLAENQWFWCFKSISTKLMEIALIYDSLLIVIEDEEEEPTEKK